MNQTRRRWSATWVLGPVAAAVLAVPALAPDARAHKRDSSPVVAACSTPVTTGAWPTGVLNFETPQCNPIVLSRRGRLYVTDTPNHRIVEMTKSGKVKRSLRVGLEPSGVAASPDGRTLYVANHLSDTVSVVDVKKWQVVATIQQIDPTTRLSVLDEPCGVAFSPTQTRAFVTLSQPNRLAVIDTTTHTVEKILDIGGEDPRAVAVSADGSNVFVAAFESGNQTEVEVPQEEETYQSGQFWWYNFLTLIVNALVNSTTGEISTPDPGANLPPRPDDDVFVIDTASWQVTPVPTVGTLLYGLATSAGDMNTLWVTGTAHQNFLDGPSELNGRPILNQLTRLTASVDGDWSKPNRKVVPLDEEAGVPVAGGAVPFGITRTKHGETLVTAASSDRLVILDRNMNVRARVPVGSMPRGVAVRGNRAWVYNRGDSTVSVVKVKQGQELRRVAFGSDPLPTDVVAGRQLFYAARMSANETFSCASCHPDGHLDQLIWNLGDGNRGTQTLRGIAGTEEFHWDGSQADAAILINGGVTGPVFQGSITPCEVDLMARFMLSVSFPPSPFRSPYDFMSNDARFGAALVRRGVWLDENDVPVNPVQFDPGLSGQIFAIGGPNMAPSEGEACATSGCHAAPLWTAAGNGAPPFIQPVTFRGLWDRNTLLHDGTPTKVANLEATNEYRNFLGYPSPYNGISNATAASAGFFTTFFRGHELTGAADPIVFHENIEAFMRELGTGAPGVLGRQVLYDGFPNGEEAQSLIEIITAASIGKVTMHLSGTANGEPLEWTWQPATSTWLTSLGATLTQAEAAAVLSAGPVLILVTADLPPNTSTQPLLRTVVVQGETVIAEAKNGQTQTFEFRGENFEPGAILLVEGIPYATLQVIDSTTAVHTEAPVNASPGFYILSVLNPNGLMSNEFPITVTGQPGGPPETFKPAPIPNPNPLG